MPRPPSGCRSAMSLCRHLPNPDVPEPAFVAVVREHDVSLDFLTKAGPVLEFALGDGRFDGLAAKFVFEHFFPVEPVLDVVALDQNTGLVPFAGRPQWFVIRRRQYIVK